MSNKASTEPLTAPTPPSSLTTTSCNVTRLKQTDGVRHTSAEHPECHALKQQQQQ